MQLKYKEIKTTKYLFKKIGCSQSVVVVVFNFFNYRISGVQYIKNEKNKSRIALPTLRGLSHGREQKYREKM